MSTAKPASDVVGWGTTIAIGSDRTASSSGGDSLSCVGFSVTPISAECCQLQLSHPTGHRQSRNPNTGSQAGRFAEFAICFGFCLDFCEQCRQHLADFSACLPSDFEQALPTPACGSHAHGQSIASTGWIDTRSATTQLMYWIVLMRRDMQALGSGIDRQMLFGLIDRIRTFPEWKPTRVRAHCQAVANGRPFTWRTNVVTQLLESGLANKRERPM